MENIKVRLAEIDASEKVRAFGTQSKHCLSDLCFRKQAAVTPRTKDRYLRLFYVTCSRAEKSLAVVYYSPDPVQARDALFQLGWFRPDEVEVLT